MIYNIQALRAFAALSVVYAHLAYMPAMRLPFQSGVYGVDVFFVVSGFIMPYITQVSSKQFFLRRLIRIVPFYWSITLALFVVVREAPELFHSTQASTELLFRSLLFLPYDSLQIVGPVVGLGWTLNYEIYFYIIFTIALTVNRQQAPMIAGGTLVLLLLVFRAMGDLAGPLSFYANTIVLEFRFGLSCFYIWKAMDRVCNWETPLPRRATVAILVVSLVALPGGEWLTVNFYGPRWLLIGVPAFSLVLSALMLERGWGLVANNRMVLALGDSSYVLYLVHVYLITTVVRMLNVEALAWKIVLVPLLMTLAAAVALFLHWYYEKPLMSTLKCALLGSVPAGQGR